MKCPALAPFAFASFALLSFSLALGCSSGTTATPAPAATVPAEAATDPVEEEADAGGTPADVCAPIPKKSKCGKQGSWVRGVAHFDPSHIKEGVKPVLRVVLRHSFIVVGGEEAVGGRLHAFASVPVEDPSKGEVPFALDMCMFASMWSEENGAFHVVLILDEDDNNDIEQAASQADSIAMGTPGPNELVKLVDVDLSCNAASPCLDVKLDCTGAACTKIDPIKSCKKKLPACGESGFCQ